MTGAVLPKFSVAALEFCHIPNSSSWLADSWFKNSLPGRILPLNNWLLNKWNNALRKRYHHWIINKWQVRSRKTPICSSNFRTERPTSRHMFLISIQKSLASRTGQDIMLANSKCFGQRHQSPLAEPQRKWHRWSEEMGGWLAGVPWNWCLEDRTLRLQAFRTNIHEVNGRPQHWPQLIRFGHASLCCNCCLHFLPDR